MTLQEQKLELAKNINPVITFEVAAGSTTDFTIENKGEIDIESVYIRCAGCTKITSVTPKEIKGTFTVPASFPNPNEAVNAADQKIIDEYGYVVKDYTSGIIVYIEDDQEVNQIVNGIFGSNPAKLFQHVQFAGKVKILSL
jgi:hypothetical protein